ncbi:hypothetical protein ACG02S_11910 [Roseateles sp. DC23W]|uniref:Uncharacterized protein n=1 Tax=Pelomonas dachongensis TaxID=3299029 RepID=A0ABW7ERF5_9BURK
MKSRLGQCWIEAGEDLGLRVAAPFELKTAAGQLVSFDALVLGFASTQGMLLMEQWDEAKAKAATENGYGYSCMDAFQYERGSAIDVLRDWGWSGAEAPPAWL